MKVLVTGGAGFIGSHLVDRLLREGLEVRVLDDFSTGRRENLEGIASDIDLIEGDICNYDTVKSAMKAVEVVFHLAAIGSVPRSVENPQKTNHVNIDGTLNVLQAAREEQRVRRLVYASSSSVYGNTRALPKRETQAPRPASPYAVTKLTGELYCRSFFQLFGLEAFSLRYFNVFGPRQNPNSQYAAVIPRFVSTLMQAKAPLIYGDGQQSRDFTFVENVVEANVAAMRAETGAGQAFNVGCGQSTSVEKLAWSIGRVLGQAIEPIYAQSRPGDVRHSFADISKAETLLGYVPRTNLQAGLRKTVGWYRSQRGNA